jgi:hypothetical protein
MPNNRNRTGRAKRRRRHDGPNFIQLYRYVLDCTAYVSLSPWARAALIEVIRGYNGSNNGKIVLSVRTLADRLACNKDTACRALRELVAKGFIEARLKGAFRCKFRRASEWRLNDRRCDATGVPPNQAFLKWQRPEQPTPKSKTWSYGLGPYGPTEPDTVAISEPWPRSYGTGHWKESISRSYRLGHFYIYQGLAAMCAADNVLQTPVRTG